MNVRQDLEPQRTLWNLAFRRVGVGLGGSLVLTGMGGSLWGWQYVNHQLAPLIATDLAHSLNRPIVLGQVERISPTGLRLGPSKLPATEGDRDEATIEAIDIGFSLTDLQTGKLGLTVTLIKPHLFIDQNADGDWLDTDLVLQNDEMLEVRQINVRDGTIVAAPFVSASKHAAPITIERVSGGVTLPGTEQTISGWLRGTSKAGGRFQTRGTFNLDTNAATGTVNLDQLAIAPFSSLLPPGFSVQSGLVSSRVRVQVALDAPLALHGTATLADFGARVPGEPNPFSDTAGQFRFDGQNVWIEHGTTRFGLIPFTLNGKIDLQNGLDLRAKVKSLSIPDFMDTFDLKVPFATGGALKTDNLRVTGPFDHVIFSGTVVDAAPLFVDRFTLKDARTEFTLDKKSDRLTLYNTEFFPVVGGSIRGQAQIRLGKENEDDVTLTATLADLSVDGLAKLYDHAPKGIPLGQLSATTRLRLKGDDLRTQMDWQVAHGSYPAHGTVVTENDTVMLRQTSVRLPGGTVNATATLLNGNWNAELNTPSLQLSGLNPELTGSAKGAVQLAGNLRSLSPDAIRATGKIDLSPDATPLAEPIAARLRWTGQRLQVQGAIADSLQLQGWVDAAFTPTGTPNITNVDLNLQVHDYELATLPLTLPDAVHVNGKTTLKGRIFGGLDDLQLAGQVTLQNLTVNAFAFAPDLTGTVHLNSDRQGRLNLSGDRDQIAIQVDQPNQHVAFQLQRGQAKTEGTWGDDRLQATAQDVPLELLTTRLPVNPMMRQINGLFSATIDADLTDASNPQAKADIAIAQLSLGLLSDSSRHGRDRFEGQVRFADGAAALTAGDLFFGNSHLQLAGQMGAKSEPELTGDLAIRHGELQDVTTVLRWLNSQNSDVNSNDRIQGLPTFLTTLLDDKSNVALDPSGTFTGRVQVRQDAVSKLQATVGLEGENWQLAGYQLDQITLPTGTFSQANGVVIPSLQATGMRYTGAENSWRSPDTTITLNADSHHQTGQIQVTQMPLEILGRVLGSPLPMNGRLQAIAQLDYSAASPHVTGTMRVDDPQINQLTLDPFQVGFNYHDGRIGLGQGATYPFAQVAMAKPSLDAKQQEKPIVTSKIDHPARLSQTLILSYGLFRPSFAMDDLESFAATGHLPSGWKLYLDLANLAPDDLRHMLTQKFTIHPGLLDDLLNSSLGNTLLTPISRVVYTSSQQQSIAALRAALVRSAQDDHQISLLECLQNYPTAEIQVNLGQLAALLNQFGSDKSQ